MTLLGGAERFGWESRSWSSDEEKRDRSGQSFARRRNI